MKLVIADDHKGLKAAATRILGATAQRCRVHFMRNLLAHAGKQGRRVVSAFVATAFAQDDADSAAAQWRLVADQLKPKAPKLAALRDEAQHDVLAYGVLVFRNQQLSEAQHITFGARFGGSPHERVQLPARSQSACERCDGERAGRSARQISHGLVNNAQLTFKLQSHGDRSVGLDAAQPYVLSVFVRGRNGSADAR